MVKKYYDEHSRSYEDISCQLSKAKEALKCGNAQNAEDLINLFSDEYYSNLEVRKVSIQTALRLKKFNLAKQRINEALAIHPSCLELIKLEFVCFY